MAERGDWGELEREFDRAEEIALDAPTLAQTFLALALAGAGLAGFAYCLG